MQQITKYISVASGAMENNISLIEDESVSLLLTDPPYNISEGKIKPVWIDKETGQDKNTIHDRNFSSSFEDDWDIVHHDAFLEQLHSWFSLTHSKLRKGGSFAIFISAQYVSHLWHIMKSIGYEPRRIITWKKPGAVPFNRKVLPVSGSEYVLWGFKPGGKRTFNVENIDPDSEQYKFAVADKVASIIHREVYKNLNHATLENIIQSCIREAEKVLNLNVVIPSTITYSNGSKNRIHPTQKPVEVLKYFISLLTNLNDLVLDPFAGSGSTGLACFNLQRRCILLEKDFEMCNKMVNNISQHTRTDILDW